MPSQRYCHTRRHRTRFWQSILAFSALSIAQQHHRVQVVDAVAFSETNVPAAKHFPESVGLEQKEHTRERINKDVKDDLNVIVVVAVDGTLAGIDKSTGRVIWKQDGSVSASSTAPSSAMQEQRMKPKPSKDDNAVSDVDILAPLLSTTTTTKSAAQSEFAAVPSVDGKVYITTASSTSPSGSGTNPSSEMRTVATSVRELIHRVPFFDPARGKFYVGSRQSSAAAIDIYTGEILQTVPTSHRKNGREDNYKSLEGRSVVWIGRIDHSVSIQDTRTGQLEVEFAVAEVVSATDIHQVEQQQKESPTSATDSSSSMHMDEIGPEGVVISQESKRSIKNRRAALVATPSGNLAFCDSDTGLLEWVADDRFDTPIAFALDAATGSSIAVDIIPDVPIPNTDLEYLSREMGRQLELVADSPEEESDQTIVGALPNGELYALPLGRRSVEHKPQSPAHHHHNGLAASNAASSKQNQAVPALSTAGNGRVVSPWHSDPHPATPIVDHDGDTPKAVSGGKRACSPNSSNFPKCLVDSRGAKPLQWEQFSKGPSGEGYLSEAARPLNGDGTELAIATHHYHPDGFYHPEYGYIPPQGFHFQSQKSQHPHQKSKLHQFLRILGSWISPTIALIFVISFEMGRRKKLKDAATKDLVEEDSLALVPGSPLLVLQHQKLIEVSDQVLGYGGQGTVVYKGMLEGRDVAVKRMLKAYDASANREISLLIESDGHPNVVRYFLKELRGDFVYLALELCDLSLHDLIAVLREYPRPTNEKGITFPLKSILFDIACGVKHIHSLRIVHRDLKPANILLAVSKSKDNKGKQLEEATTMSMFSQGLYVAKISDMGLGKQLMGQSSVGASLIAESSLRGTKAGQNSIGVGPGSVGWQAPEVMSMRWAASDISVKSGESAASDKNAKQKMGGAGAAPNLRTSRSVDIFSLGCIFYSTLVPGNHPFGEWFEREANIVHNKPNLEVLREWSPNAFDLVSRMLHRNAKQRPTAAQICEHPFFWSSQKKLMLLCEFSDRLETDMTASSSAAKINAMTIEKGAVDVVGTAWDRQLDDPLINNMTKFRTYDPSSVRDLLRLIRNKHHHFDELPVDFRVASVATQDALFEYFEARFPHLLMHCYNCCRQELTQDDPLTEKFSIAIDLTTDMNVVPSLTPENFVVKMSEHTMPDEGKAELVIPINDGGLEQNPEPSSPKAASSDSEWEKIVTPLPIAAGVTTTSDSMEDKGENYTMSTLRSVLPVAMESPSEAEDLIVWEGSAAAKTFNCRGWSRSEGEWSSRIDPIYKKVDPNLKRALTEPLFRTRLCNHWDVNRGEFCRMRKRGKCIFAHGPVELRVKEAKRKRWGKLLDKNGNNSNPCHSGGEDTYGAARAIEKTRKQEGKWKVKNGNKGGNASKKANSRNTAPVKKVETSE